MEKSNSKVSLVGCGHRKSHHSEPACPASKAFPIVFEKTWHLMDLFYFQLQAAKFSKITAVVDGN